MEIKTMKKDDEKYILKAAYLLLEGFKDNWQDAWPDLESAMEEVKECLGEDRICRIAIDENDNVIGWVGFNFPLVFLVGCGMDIKVIRFGYEWEWIGFFAISRPTRSLACRRISRHVSQDSHGRESKMPLADKL